MLLSVIRLQRKSAVAAAFGRIGCACQEAPSKTWSALANSRYPRTALTLPIGSTALSGMPQYRGMASFRENTTSRNLRAYPQYSIYGETCMLAVRVILPTFRINRGDVISVDPNRKGRILLEFSPRGPDGKFVWEDKIRFGMSPEEVGLVCNQLPHYEVELSRLQRGDDSINEGSPAAGGVEMPEKVLKIKPGEGGAVTFTVDYVLNSVGGQSPGPGQEGKAGPLEVQVQLGEFECVSSIMKSSIPHLTGWTSTFEIAMQNAVRDGSNYSGGSGSGSFDSYSVSGGNNVPF